MSTPPEAPLSAPFSLLSSFGVESRLRDLQELGSKDGTLFEIEQELRETVRCFEAAIVALAKEALEARDESSSRPLCPRCRIPMRKNRRERLDLQLLEGRLEILRGYWECRPCKVRRHPLDESLELPAEGEVAFQLGHDLCLLGVELPYRAAGRVLQALTGCKLDWTTIRNQVLRDGTALFELQKQEAEIHMANPPPRERDRRLAELPNLHAPPAVVGNVLVAELDGVMGNLGRDVAILAEKKAWEQRRKAAAETKPALPFSEPEPSVFREILQARLYRRKDRLRTRSKSGKMRGQLLHSETVSVVNDPRRFESLLYATAQSWKADSYKTRVVLGDGAVFERGLHEGLRPHYEILDFKHAKSHLYDCARKLYGEGSKEGRGWAKRFTDILFEKGPAPLLAELRRLSVFAWEQEAKHRLANLLDYVTRHRNRMRYPTFRKLELPIATGAIEGANRQVVGDRCKRSGMGWSKASLQALLSLRAALLSNNWERACAAIREHRSRRPAQDLELETKPTVKVLPLEPLNSRPSFGEQASENGTARTRPPSRPLFSERLQARKLHSGLLRQTEDGVMIGSAVAS